MIAYDGRPLLCNFGFSQIRHEVTHSTATTVRERGRLRYLAPELLERSDDDFHTSKASDIYALAMTFLSVGTLQQPFAEFPNQYAAAAAARSGIRPLRINRINDFSSSMSKDFWAILETMWSHEASDRLTAEDVVDRMGTLLDSLV